MKKFLIVAFAAMFCLCANAQLRTSRTFFKKEGRGTEWILRAGLSINNIAGLDLYDDDRDISLGSKTGFAVDFGFNKYFGQSNVYWGMELGLGTRGASLNYEGDKASFSAINVKLSPFTVGYKVPVAESIKIDPHIGLYATYDVSQDRGHDYFYTCDEFDLGVQLGVGFWYNKVNLDFMYQRGFDDAVDVRGFDGYGKASNFLIRLGYSF